MWSRVVGLSIAIAFFFQPLGVDAAVTPQARNFAHAARRSSATHALPPICPSDLQLQQPAACPSLGPGGYVSRIVAAGLPYPFPSLPIPPVHPFRGLTPAAY